jgi:hypothetical protein
LHTDVHELRQLQLVPLVDWAGVFFSVLTTACNAGVGR